MARNLLRRIKDSDDQELVYSKGGGWWVDDHKTSGRAAFSLIRRVLISLEHGELGGYEIWTINEEGELALEDKNYVPKIFKIFL